MSTSCQKCGYVLDPFETDCPRCKRLGAGAVKKPPAPPPAATISNEEVKKIARQMAVKPKPETVASNEYMGYEPPLGWPTTVLLIILALGQLVIIVMKLLEGGIFDPIMYVMREVGTIGLIMGQRWAFKEFALTSVVPAMILLMWEGFKDPLDLAIFIVPAFIVFAMVLGKLDQLD